AVIGGILDAALHGAVEGGGGAQMVRGSLDTAHRGVDLIGVIGHERKPQIVQRREYVGGGWCAVVVLSVEDIAGALGDSETAARRVLHAARSGADVERGDARGRGQIELVGGAGVLIAAENVAS